MIVSYTFSKPLSPSPQKNKWQKKLKGFTFSTHFTLVLSNVIKRDRQHYYLAQVGKYTFNQKQYFHHQQNNFPFYFLIKSSNGPLSKRLPASQGDWI